MNEEQNNTVDPSEIQTEKGRLHQLVFNELDRIGRAMSGHKTSVGKGGQEFHVQVSLSERCSEITTAIYYLHAILKSYHTKEYLEKVEELKSKMFVNYENKHALSEDRKYIPLVRYDPQQYFIYLMEWLELLNKPLQKCGFMEAGRESYYFNDKMRELAKQERE